MSNDQTCIRTIRVVDESNFLDVLDEIERESFNPYAPKGNFVENCGILALMLRNPGIANETVAVAFNRSKATVAKMKNPKIYGPIHRELALLGMDEFAERYLTKDIVDRINSVYHERREKMMQRSTPANPLFPDKRRSKGSGPVVAGNGDRINVLWYDQLPYELMNNTPEECVGPQFGWVLRFTSGEFEGAVMGRMLSDGKFSTFLSAQEARDYVGEDPWFKF